MTSDQVNSGEAELQLAPNVLTGKSYGLNPNATIFQYKAPSESGEPPNWEDGQPQDEPVPGFTYMNGDEDKYPHPVDKVQPEEEFPPPASALNGSVLPDLIATSDPLAQAASMPASDDATSIEGSVPEDQLRTMLKDQLEYCLSRENLASDNYLVSQMDADQYIPISTIASIGMIKKLSSNIDLITEVLRECLNVQVEEKGEKVRPLYKRCIVILREIPDNTPVEEVKGLFAGENCPKFINCEFAHNNSWYVTFDSDDDAQRAYRYLREEIRTFQGKPIMARIKAKPLLRPTYIPKNGYRAQQQFDPNSPTYQQQQRPQYTPTTFTTAVPTAVQYLPSQPQQAFPFYPPQTNAMIQATWQAAPSYFDAGVVFAANGYQYKLTNSSGRHGYQNIRTRNQNKPHNRNQNNIVERSVESRPNHDRYSSNPSHHRTSPRGDVYSNHRKDSSSSYTSNYNSSHNSHSHSVSDSGPQPISSRNMDVSVREPPPALQRRGPPFKGPRSRRREEEERVPPPRNTRPPPSSPAKPESNKFSAEPPKFELESTSFPPLPGCMKSQATGDIFENKMSDVVKGTAKPLTREIKTQVPLSPVHVKETPTSPPVVSVSSTATSTDTPSQSPKKVSKSTSTNTEITSVSKSEAPVSPTQGAPSKASKASETVSVSTGTTSVPASTQTQPLKTPPVSTAQQSPHPAIAKPAEVSQPVKFSYAAIVQRATSTEKKDEEVSSQTTEEETSDKTAPLKEQSQVSRGSTASRDEPKDQRPQSRRMKENRADRRAGRGPRPRSPTK